MGKMLLRAMVALLPLFLLACSKSDGGSPRTTLPPIGASPTTASDAGGSIPNVQLTRVFPSLQFARMTGLYQAPDGRWYALEQAGRIFVFDDRQDAQAS